MNHIQYQNQQISPLKIICIGRNYVGHIQELNNELLDDIPENMTIFLKPNSAITTVLNAKHIEALHYEAELCFLIKNKKINAVAIGLDLTKRELQTELKNKGMPWERCKAFNGSALFSQFIEFNGNVANLNFTLDIDGKNTQTGNVGLMIYKPDVILAELQNFMSLEDGDIIMSGTPAGVGVIKPTQEFVGSLYDGDKLLTQQVWQAV